MPRRKLDTPHSQFTRALAALWGAMAGAGLSPAETIAEWVWPSEDPEKKAWTVYKWKEGTRHPTDWEQVWRLDEMAHAAGFTQFTASRFAAGAEEGDRSLIGEALHVGELSGLICTLARKPFSDVSDDELGECEHMATVLLKKIQGERRSRCDGRDLILSAAGGDGSKTGARL